MIYKFFANMFGFLMVGSELNKCQMIPKEQSKTDNPEKLAHKTKTNKVKT